MQEEFLKGEEDPHLMSMLSDENVRIKQISAGGHHTLILTSDGQVYSFGYGSHGQLGHKNTLNYFEPKLVNDLKNVQIEQVAAGWNHSIVLAKTGDIYVCGHGDYGQLGLGETVSKTRFTLLEAVKNKNVYTIFAGGNHSWMVLDETEPVRSTWRPPKPLMEDAKAKEEDTSSSFQPINFFETNAVAQSKYAIQIIYTDTSLSHRFIRCQLTEEH